MIADRLLVASIETTLAALIVLVLGFMIGRRSPRIIALLWLVVLAKPLLTLGFGSLVQLQMPFASSTAVQIDVTQNIQRGGNSHEELMSTSRGPFRAINAIWLTGAMVMFARTIHGRLRLRSIIRGSRTAAPRVQWIYESLAASPPRLVVSDALEGPAIAGVFHPAVILPAWMEARAGDEQLVWTLRHELRHAAAHDTLGIALREASLIAFWFHPAVWLAAHRWEAAAELACDRDVVSNDDDAVDYADALYGTLLNVRRQKRLAFASGLFATRSKIGARIAALIEHPLPRRSGRIVAVAATIVATAVIAVGGGFAKHGRHRGHIEEINDQRSLVIDYHDDVADFRETSRGTTRHLRINGEKRFYDVNERAAPIDPAFEARMRAQMLRAQMH
jgi:beta-lactamase regulating signal transducer with metallopeptidase domain